MTPIMFLSLIALILIIAAFIIWSFLGIVIIPEDRVGLVTKKFAMRSLPDGKIIAVNKEAGYQADTLSPGIHLWKFWFQYEVTKVRFTIVPPGSIGLLIARDGVEIPVGRILGRKIPCDNFQSARDFLINGGQKGRQTAYITAGSYRINTNLFEINIEPMVKIKDNMVGIITAFDGEPLTSGQIAGEMVEGHNNFQDADAFLINSGKRGLQQQVVLAGNYNINPWFVGVEEKPMTDIAIGHVGVVVSFAGNEGSDLTGDAFKHGNIVAKGSKGVWVTPYDPGKYPLNTYIMKIESVPTTNIVLNWATGRNESHKLDEKLSTISVISRDGFKFSVDVSQIIHIPSKEAPQVIARFGSMQNLVSQVLEPMIANYFRNSAQTREVIDFLAEREMIQAESKKYISDILKEYNVIGVDTLIGDIVPPADLMKTLTDKKIAEKQKDAYKTQMEAQTVRQELEKQTAIANMQSRVVEAERGVEIAEKNANSQVKKAEGESKAIELIAGANARQIELLGEAEAKKISAIGESNAEAYKLAVSAMGANGFTYMKIMESIGNNKVKIVPEILISGSSSEGGSDNIGALVGLEVLKKVKENFTDSKNREYGSNPDIENKNV